MVWNETDLETRLPENLGVTLDMSICYKEHIQNTKMKVATRDNLLTKLANPSTIRMTVLAMSYSMTEYAVQVWARSPHAKNLDPGQNKQVDQSQDVNSQPRLRTCICYRESPSCNQEVCARVEIQTHSLFGQIPATKRLKFRHCFLSSVQSTNFPVKVIRCLEWRNRLRNKPHIDIINLHKRQSMDHVEIPQSHGVNLQQDTKKEVEVLHRRHHLCLWKSRRNHGTHVTVLPTCTSILVR